MTSEPPAFGVVRCGTFEKQHERHKALPNHLEQIHHTLTLKCSTPFSSLLTPHPPHPHRHASGWPGAAVWGGLGFEFAHSNRVLEKGCFFQTMRNAHILVMCDHI
jgi:hypothetical protein